MRLRYLVLFALLVSSPLGAAPKTYDSGSWESIRRAHAGRVLVVHFWGMTCGPCVVELPEWAKLQKTWPKARFVFVQADPIPAPIGSDVLQQAGLGRMESWVFAAGANEERLRYEADPRWRGELPKTVLVAPDGKVTPLRNGTDFERIKAWLKTQAP
jgi:thiol-disulfide isomerase/thioredoxin